MKEKNRLRGILCALLGGVCWGASGTVGQFLFTQKGIDSSWLTVVRMFGAGVILLSIALVKFAQEAKNIWRSREDALRLIAFSVFGLMTCQYTYLAAISYSNSATATVLQYLGQALVLLWACLRGKRLPTLREATALVLALGGVFLLSTHGSITTLYLSPKALFWGLAAAVALFLYTTLPGDLLRRYGTPVCTGYGMFVGGIVLLLITRAWQYEVKLDFTAMLGVFEIVVVGTALAFTLYLQGVSDLGGVRASLFACSEPVCAALLTGVWLKTKFAMQDIAGIVMIIVMALLLSLPEKKKDAV